MKHVSVTVLLAFYVFTSVAQDSTAQRAIVQDTIVQNTVAMDTTVLDKKPESDWAKNVIKLNLTSLFQKNLMLQYERVTAKRQSLAISIGYATNVDLPFKSNLLDQFDENDDAKSAIETTTFDKITITPEYRFYFGKKRAPAGFYIAPFLRYSHMTTEGDYQFQTLDDEETGDPNVFHTAHLKGKFDGWGGGVMFGAQWLFGKKKNIALDWWIVGLGYGALKGDFHGTDYEALTNEEAANLEKDIEATDIPGWEINATVGNTVTDATVKGPFYALRAFGICIGYRF